MVLENTNQWILVLDNVDNLNHYPVNWMAVCEYADIEASTYLHYSLHEEPTSRSSSQSGVMTNLNIYCTVDRWCRCCLNGIVHCYSMLDVVRFHFQWYSSSREVPTNKSITIIFFSIFFPFFFSFFLFKETYYWTNPKEWTKINNNGDNGRMVNSVSFHWYWQRLHY